MQIEIRKKFAEKVGVEVFEQFGLNKGEWWRTTYSRSFTLERLSDAKIGKLIALLEKHTKAYGVKELIENIRFWQHAQEHPDAVLDKPARNCQQFSIMLKAYLAQVDGHRVYRHDPDFHNGIWLAYYVNKITYHPRRVEGSGKDKYVVPPSVSMDLVYQKYEQMCGETVHFNEHECYTTAHRAMMRKQYYGEQEKLRAQYLQEAAAYNQITDKIGMQLWASGYGSDNTDGNESRRGDSWYWNRTKLIPLTWNDGPAKVVSDVLSEDEEKNERARSRREEKHVDEEFWKTVSAYRTDEDGNAVIDEGDEEDTDDEEVDASVVAEWEQPEQDKADKRGQIEVPLHPFCVVFDLHKHMRLKVHVSQLEEYKYDKKLADKLVLPEDLKHLVKLLVESKGAAFSDIVQGKSGGAIVLLAGRPGTGKTLTAEVFAESEERPLYSVQCSQLGVDADTIEESLMKVFARAKRWNAVMLLDEADVYIHERGDDLKQNAIVGVFLRVLEYQAKVLFLTTNRVNDVDDAVASRCIAKLVYAAPTAEEQEHIWRVLADSSGIKISDKAIKEIVKASDGLTGRDVKNLLKLGRLMAGKEGVTPKIIELVKKFKPTGD